MSSSLGEKSSQKVYEKQTLTSEGNRVRKRLSGQESCLGLPWLALTLTWTGVSTGTQEKVGNTHHPVSGQSHPEIQPRCYHKQAN